MLLSKACLCKWKVDFAAGLSVAGYISWRGEAGGMLRWAASACEPFSRSYIKNTSLEFVHLADRQLLGLS